ncbi:cytochrome b ascorbate-dependent protein 3 [Rhypophila decipiens]|uniref:Cytochrome b ascorbate-dependent protein 3 n=1 Tax=Rhypophila decipiens TaxID=261697 RepID=A0AAN6Y4S3_9PEZI|nr:cytochrome b ascorbate-dependent protein 3 [Rhypophila decipiens]
MASESPSTQVTAEPRVETPSAQATEYEPLLGRPGDAIQRQDAPMINNLWLGTGWLAQIGAFFLVATTWSGVFSHPLLALVSPHPLLQSFGVFLLIQAILILQPTTTPQAKLHGQRVHAGLQLLSFLIFLTGVTIIETNKHVNHMDHFHSVHGYLGTATVVLLVFQYTFGFFMWAVPSVFGGVERAKATWKYHRYGGYALLILVLATVISAVETDYNKGVLDIKMWAIGLSVGLILVGVFPRIQLFKLGFHRA